MKNLILLIAVLISFGCLKKKDDEIIQSGKISTDFHGTWEACLTDGTDFIGIRQVISEYTVIHTETLYENGPGCSNGDVLLKIDSVNNIIRQSPLTLKMTSTTITPMTSTVATNFNTAYLCIYQNWSSGVPHDVTGWDCGNDLDFSDSTPFEVYYTRNGNTLELNDGEESQYTLTLVQ